jgi:hypothetical protein
MTNAVRKVVGAFLVLAGAVGLLMCAMALAVLPRVERSLDAGVASKLDILVRATDATVDGLAIADATLLRTIDAIGSLQTAVTAIGSTVESSRPTLDTVAALLGETLPGAIEATQETLLSASVNAKAVDDFLALLAGVPFLGAQRYAPEQQLHVGLEQVATSLDGVPASLRVARKSLADASGSLQDLQQGLKVTAANVGETADGLDAARATLGEYRDIVADLGASLASARASLPRYLRWLRLGCSLLLAWFGIVQVSLITQGADLIGRSRQYQPRVDAEGS